MCLLRLFYYIFILRGCLVDDKLYEIFKKVGNIGLL